MIPINSGITREQFIENCNVNFIELAFNCGANIDSFKLLGFEMSQQQILDAIHYNFRVVNLEFGDNSSSFITNLNLNFNTIIKRFNDTIIQGLPGAEPTALVSEDEEQLDLWASGSAGAIGYSFSTDGLTFSEPVATDIPSGWMTSHIMKYEGVYYLFAANETYTSIHRFHGTDKIHFTDDGEVIGLGLEADPDTRNVANSFVWVENGIWYIIYEARPITPIIWGICLATSNDGLTFTKYVGNPVITAEFTGAGNPEMPRVNNQLIKYNNKYFCYYHTGETEVPTFIRRAWSYDLHTWNYEGDTLNTRISDAPNWTNGDQCLCQFKGKSYLFYTNSNQHGTSNIDVGIDNRPLIELLSLMP